MSSHIKILTIQMESFSTTLGDLNHLHGYMSEKILLNVMKYM
jgi:hypothetical protein